MYYSKISDYKIPILRQITLHAIATKSIYSIDNSYVHEVCIYSVSPPPK